MKMKFWKALVCLVLIASMAFAPMTAMAASKTMQILKVNTSGVRLRDPLDKSVMKTLREGTKVFYAGDRKDAFCKVCTMDGEVGYVFKEYLSEYGVVKTSQIYVTTEKSAAYRRSSSSGLKRTGSIAKNTVMLVLDKNGNWAQVQSMDGEVRYMRMDTLKRAF